jgi:outer membrane autotransporter protein
LVTRSLIGSGGIFGMNVNLPALIGDLLVVQTASAGFNEHHLQIINLDQSHDPGVNKALLVVISAQTSGLEFPSNQVDAGTFKYQSRRGNNTTVTPDPNNWYLVRTDTPEPSPTPTPSPTPIPSPSPPPIPTPTPEPGASPSATPQPSPTPTASPTPRPTPRPSPTPPSGESNLDSPKPLDPANALTNTANAAIGTFSSLIPLFYADMQSLIERMGELRLGIQRTVIPAPPTTTKEVVGGKGGLESKEIAPVPPPSNEWGVWVRGLRHRHENI